MRLIATDVARSVVCVSVCLSVCVFDIQMSPAKTDRDAVWAADSCGSKKPCVRLGFRFRTERGTLEQAMRPFAKLLWTLVIIIIIAIISSFIN